MSIGTRAPRRAVLRRLLARARAGIGVDASRRAQPRLAGPQILQAFAAAYPHARFVEIGANDGDQHDHLRPFVDSYPWTGIMVEPVPYVFERLVTNYASRPNITLANVAVADRDGELPFYHLAQADEDEAADLPRWYDGIGSFLKEPVLGHVALVPGLENRLRCVQVPALTFSSLCRRYGLEDVDLLLVDTEGYDREILRHVDWNAYRPRLIIFEHYHLSQADRSELRDELGGLGYELKEEGFDTWCLRTAVEDDLTAIFRRTPPAIRAQTVSEDR